jgi:hypothetical protein
MAEWGNPAGGDVRHHQFRLVKRTRGTETSQYLEEEKSTEMPLVVASERGGAQTRSPWGSGVVGPTDARAEVSRSPLERGARDGESPVGEDDVARVVEFLSSALVPRNEA